MAKKLTLISVLLITLVVSCKSRSNDIPRPPSGEKNASELKVTSQREAFVEETQLLSLSPSGKWFFALRLDSICIVDAATLADMVCSGWKATLDPNSIAWSPDSQRVAFSENLPQLMESDLWVFDIPSGVLSNLTNDKLEGDLATTLERAQSDKVDINLDSLPAWSPDNKTIAFVRSIYGNTKQTILCLISATGGEVTKLLIADSQHSLAVWRGLHWTPDGKKILFTITILDDETGKNGIWIVDKNGKNFKQLVKEKEGWGYVSLYDVSAKGDKALIGYPRGIAGVNQNPNLCFFELVDLKTGNLTPLVETSTDIDQSGNQAVFYSPTQAAFSPDGSKIVYHYNLAGEDRPTPQLVVRDVEDTRQEVLGSWSIYHGDDVGSSLFWAENDTIYLMTGPGMGILYQLGSK
jgi:dipeptidyl aminopeptidase/acylaminoacyl peptidase